MYERVMKMRYDIAYIGGGIGVLMIIKSVFMHDPIRLLAVRGSPRVENQSLPHSNPFGTGVDDLIPASSLPETDRSGAIRSSACWILLVFMTEEVPIVLWGGSNFALVCKIHPKPR